MKKVIFLVIAIISMVAIANAQSVTVPPMGVGITYQLYSTDTNVTNTTVRTFVFNAPQNFPTTQDYIVKLDSVSGNHTNVAVALYGQKSALKGDWTQIGSTINWKGTTADTVIVISNASANRYRNYKIVYTGTGTGVTKVNEQELKLYLE